MIQVLRYLKPRNAHKSAETEYKDERVVQLIKRYLKKGVMENGVVMETEEGSPQGGNLLPLLANVCLNEFDHEFGNKGRQPDKDGSATRFGEAGRKQPPRLLVQDTYSCYKYCNDKRKFNGGK